MGDSRVTRATITYLMMSMMEASRCWRLTLEGAAAGTAHGGIVGACCLLHGTLVSSRCSRMGVVCMVGGMMMVSSSRCMMMRMGMGPMGMAMMMIGRRSRLQHFV